MLFYTALLLLVVFFFTCNDRRLLMDRRVLVHSTTTSKEKEEEGWLLIASSSGECSSIQLHKSSLIAFAIDLLREKWYYIEKRARYLDLWCGDEMSCY